MSSFSTSFLDNHVTIIAGIVIVLILAILLCGSTKHYLTSLEGSPSWAGINYNPSLDKNYKEWWVPTKSTLMATPVASCPAPNGQTCSGHGVCKGNTCQCSTGWSDKDCSVAGITTPTMCYMDRAGNTCFGNGTCDPAGSGMCFCKPNYWGMYCQYNGTESMTEQIVKNIYAAAPSSMRPWVNAEWNFLGDLTSQLCQSVTDPVSTGQKIVNNFIAHPPAWPIYNASIENSISQVCRPGAPTLLSEVAKNATTHDPDVSPF